jgi:hypothetical protein
MARKYLISGVVAIPVGQYVVSYCQTKKQAVAVTNIAVFQSEMLILVKQEAFSGMLQV